MSTILQTQTEWRADASKRRDFPKLAAYLAWKKAQSSTRSQAANAHLVHLEKIGARHQKISSPQTYVPADAEAAAQRAIAAGAVRISGDAPEPHIELPAAAPLTAGDYESFWRATPELHAEFPTAKIYAAFQKANRVGAVNI